MLHDFVNLIWSIDWDVILFSAIVATGVVLILVHLQKAYYTRRLRNAQAETARRARKSNPPDPQRFKLAELTTYELSNRGLETDIHFYVEEKFFVAVAIIEALHRTLEEEDYEYENLDSFLTEIAERIKRKGPRGKTLKEAIKQLRKH